MVRIKHDDTATCIIVKLANYHGPSCKSQEYCLTKETSRELWDNGHISLSFSWYCITPFR